jgi:erythromycin esterase-like protein
VARPIRYPAHEPAATDEITEAVREISRPLDDWESLDPLLARIGDARYVLLGEASHGTSEFYAWRRLISQRLICEKGFSLIAVEGDWPDCYRVNRFIKSYPDSGRNAYEVLHAFDRWPTWMWANEEVVTLAEWLHQWNRTVDAERKVGFYGLDVYSLWDSMHAVLDYLGCADGSALAAARRAFECFGPFGYDVDQYAHATAWTPRSCENDVVDMLRALREQAPTFRHDGREAFFNAEQNALVAKNAERYYRTMVRGDALSWNVRDEHMAETLNRLTAHYGPQSRAIVWEHNTHVGDARYTDMAASGMVNVGQLVRNNHEADGVVLVGFSSHHGTVIASEAWGDAMRVMTVPAARPGSWEDVLHHADPGDKLLVFDRRSPLELLEPRGHRAIGVVYRPQHEAFGNYVPSVLPRRYDALVYLDETHALHPLHVDARFERELPETFPTGV